MKTVFENWKLYIQINLDGKTFDSVTLLTGSLPIFLSLYWGVDLPTTNPVAVFSSKQYSARKVFFCYPWAD